MKVNDLEKQKKEIEQRIEKLKVGDKPKRLKNIDWENVIGIAESYINDLAKEGYANDDYDNWFFEAVIEAVFGGGKTWDWINKKLD